MKLPDTQSSTDNRQKAINWAGIKDIRYPFIFQNQPTMAKFGLYVLVQKNQKGVHMSRFVEFLQAHKKQNWDLDFLDSAVKKIAQKLESTDAKMCIDFYYFLEKTAPISKLKSLLDYQIQLVWKYHNGQYQKNIQIKIPVTSLCPCSKNISDFGAHNQRSVISIDCLINNNFDITQTIKAIEKKASCEVYALLKHPDEKFVTEYAYQNPYFVEDIVRDCAAVLDANKAIEHYRIEAENFESIHNHSAAAVIKK